MEKKMFLYCYKMTHDTGFAPNPYHGVLTLATCKPTIRRCADIGYWISGWTSNQVQGKTQKFDFRGKPQKLIYLAKVTNKITIEEYWDAYDFKRPKIILKGPEKTASSCRGKKHPSNTIFDTGDNIYKPIKGEKGRFKLLPNGGGHDEKNKQHDLSGIYVLICEEFYYFGVENATKIEVKKGFVVPRCKKIPLDEEKAQSIIEQVKKKYEQEIKLKQL